MPARACQDLPDMPDVVARAPRFGLMQHYRAPCGWPVPGALGGHVQTIWPALFQPRA